MQNLMTKTLKTAALLGAVGAVSLLGAAQAAGVPDQGIWTRSLQARELDGNLANGPEAFYDTTLDITWLANASQNGSMSWDAATTWASNLSVAGVTGWRLPTVIDTGAAGCQWSHAGGTDCGYNVQTKSGLPTKYQAGQTVYSEMAHLFYVTLGNNASYAPGTGEPQDDWGLTNTGGFENLQSFGYWSGTTYAPDSIFAWSFYSLDGYQNGIGRHLNLYALAVRPGDVAVAVPEPQTWALTLLGLTGVLLARRRRAL
jgi:hypothetical protein